VPKPKNLEGVEKDYPALDVSFGRGYSSLLKYLAPLGALLNLGLYLEFPHFLNFLSIILLYITLYLFKREYFERSRILKLAGVLAVVLYALFYRIL